MPNPQGYNAFGGPMEHQAPYGAAQKEKDLLSLAPISQRVPSAQNAPRRAQRHATGRDRPQGQADGPAVPPAQPVVPPENIALSFWQQLAAEPGASELIRQYAQEAGSQ